MMKKLMAIFLTFVLLASGITITYAADLAVVSVDPVGGTSDAPTKISAHSGQFAITFAQAVTEDILSTIAFTDAEDNDIKGGIYPVIDKENNAKVIVKYGALENGKYTLKIGSAEHIYLAEGFEITEDFED
ncbi:MAG: hypothetical protein IJA16_00945, partial [Clostridia bacterium]|nr:hypothetical protein [Clostridia bacterium]